MPWPHQSTGEEPGCGAHAAKIRSVDKGKIVVELREQDMREQAGSGHAARSGARAPGLRDPLAAPAGLFGRAVSITFSFAVISSRISPTSSPISRRLAAAIRTGFAGVKHDALARRPCRHLRLAPLGRALAAGGPSRSLRRHLSGSGPRRRRPRPPALRGPARAARFRARSSPSWRRTLAPELGDTDSGAPRSAPQRAQRGLHPLRVRPHGRVLRLERGDLRPDSAGSSGKG